MLLTAACGTTVNVPVAPQAGGPLPGAAAGDGLSAPESAPAVGPDVGAPAGSSTGTGNGVGSSVGGGVALQGAAPVGQVGPPAGKPMTRAAAAVDRRPVKVGLIYINNDEAAAAAGVSNGNTFTPKAAFNAMVKAFNARGGLAGRRIVPIAVELSSNSTSLQADLQAACSRFSEDENVAVVFSAIGLFNEAFSRCLAGAGIPQVTGDYSFGDSVALQAIPTLLGVSTLTVDDRATALLTRMTAAGRLTRTHALGVVVEGCVHNTRAYERTVEPLAQRLGVPVAESVETRCFEDIGDLGGLGSDMQNAVLRFQTRGITHVTFVSGSVEGNAMFLFATAAEAQGYRPTYLLTSAAVAAVQETNTSEAQLQNAYGLGWIPSIDTSRSGLTGPAGRRCLRDLRAGAGITPQSPTDRYYAASTCDVFALYEAALRLTGGAADTATVMAAVAALRTSFGSAAAYGEATDFTNRRTGAAQGRVFAWVPGCGCFDYTGQPFSLLAR